MLSDIAVILIGYLLGSIPFAYLVTRAVTGKDIRFEGEGNVGARNVMYVAGRVPGLLALLLDAVKGAAAYWVAARFGSGVLATYLAGFALLLGHGFPVWLGWRGGKGLGPAAGFLIQIWPLSVIGAMIVCGVARQFIPDFNLAFSVGGVTFPFFTWIEGNNLAGFIFIVCFLGLTGVKKVIDLPHERAMRANTRSAGPCFSWPCLPYCSCRPMPSCTWPGGKGSATRRTSPSLYFRSSSRGLPCGSSTGGLPSPGAMPC